jgi:hypothetical protein
MNTKIFKSVSFCWIILLTSMLFIVSCRKYNSLGFDPGKGAPSISSVHTWSKTDTTARYDTILSYNSSGALVTTLVQRPAQVNAFDSATTAGNLGTYYIINGANLGSTTNVAFNGYTAYFNRALITDNSLVVQVPSKTPYYGPQANDSLVVTTLYGRASYKFSILPPPPTVTSYSNYNFSPSTATASQITLSGVGFASVTSVRIEGPGSTTGTTSIVSASDSILVLKFNATTLMKGFLVFTYNAGGTPRTANGTQELINLDNAYQIFTDNIAPGWGSWSWDNTQTSTVKVKTGTQSWNAQFSGNGWKINGFRNGGGGATDGVQFTAGYTYLSFWLYGGNAEQKIYIEWGNLGFANGGANQINTIIVPPNKWTYFKLPISGLLWNTTATAWAAHTSEYLNTVAFFMNSNSATEQVYFDDVILIK